LEIVGKRPVQTLAITGGKGGTGKSSIAVNLAAALAAQDEHVLLLDADLGLGNVARLMGLSPVRTLADVLRGHCELQDVLLEGPPGVSVIPAANGEVDMARLSQHHHADFISQFCQSDIQADTLIVDMATGLSAAGLIYTQAAREVVVVVSDGPAVMQDAYSTIRALHKQYCINRFRIVANQSESTSHGLDLYAALARHTEDDLDVVLDYCGSIPNDERVRQAAAAGQSVVEAFPRSAATMAFRKLAKKVARWPRPASPGGHIEFFVERLIKPPMTVGESVQ